MSDIEHLKNIIHQSLELSKLGQDEEALALLDHSLSQAVRENRVEWIQILSQHAAVLSDSVGDLQRLKHYYEQYLASDPDNSMALYGLAKALQRQGETALAKQHASKCYRCIRHSDSELDRALLELVVKTWPEFTQSQSEGMVS